MGLQLRPALAPALDVPGSNAPSSYWEELAEKYWLQSIPSKVKPDLIKTAIWDHLEQDSFSFYTLSLLENLQIFERFLWPTFSHDSSNHHVLLLAIFFNVKQRAHLQDWSLFTNHLDHFSALFHRILSLNLDSSLPVFSRLALLNFVIGAFQSLENDHVRKEAAPLVSIAIWHNLQGDTGREALFDAQPARRKAWRAAQRRYTAADQEAQARLRFDRAWLYTMLLDFLSRVNAPKLVTSQDMVYCERFTEFLIDLISQLPTRRYTNPLLQDLNILPALRTSSFHSRQEGALLCNLTDLLEHFQTFDIDDLGNTKSGSEGTRKAHYHALARLQKVAFQNFESKLKVLAFSNYGSINKRTELQSHFEPLTDTELQQLCSFSESALRTLPRAD